MATKEEKYAEAYRRGILPPDKKARYEEAVRRGLMHNPELKAQLEGVDLPDITFPQQPKETSAETALKESARALITGASSLADIIPEVGDSFVSAAVWAGNKLGIGDGTYTPATRFKGMLPEWAKPQTPEGRLAAEIIPYLVPEGKAADAPALARRLEGLGEKLMGRGESFWRRTADSAAHAAGQSGVGALAQSDSTGENPLGLMAENGVFGGILHNTGRLLGAGYRAVTGAPVAAEADIMREALRQGVHPGAARPIPELVQNVGKAAKRGNVKPGDELAYAVNPSEDILQAARDLEMEDLLLPSHFSTNPAYQAIEQGLKSIPGSVLDAHERKAIEVLANKTDDLISEFGGTVDKAELSDRFKTRQMEQIRALEEKANELFDDIENQIGRDRLVSTKNIMEHLNEKADTLGGAEYLSQPEQSVLRQMNEETMPTYARLAAVRQQVGDALGRKQGPFKDVPTGELKQLYAKLSEDQHFAAHYYGVGGEYSLANDLVFQRKALEKDLVNLLGKDLSNAITDKAGRGVKSLMKGNFKAFDQVLSRIPQDMREELVLTALNDAFTQGSRKEKMLNIPGFVDWYQGMMRSPEAMKRITHNIPKEAAVRLKNIYEVANGIRQAKSREISTGRIQTLIDQFDKDNGLLAKVFGVAGKTAAAGAAGGLGGAPAAAVTSTAISLLSRPKDKITVLADRLLASNEFKSFVKQIAGGNANTAAQRERLEKLIAKSETYQKWERALSPEVQQTIARVGLVNWLSGSSDKEP